MPRKPVKRNLSLRTVDPKSGRIIGAVDAAGISPSKARKMTDYYGKLTQRIVPGHHVRAVETPSASEHEQAVVRWPSDLPSKGSFVSMSEIPQARWDAIFGKNKKAVPKKGKKRK